VKTKNLSKRTLLTVATLLASIAGVITISRVWLADMSIRLDESQSLWQTSHSLAGTIHTVALDVHVPLYHVLLHTTMFYFGDSLTVARTISLIFFVLSIPVFYLLARNILSYKWSLFAVVLFAISPFMNWYANEARMYTMLVFFSLLNQYFFLRLLKGKSGWLGYALSAVFGIYTHYFFWFELVAQALFYLGFRKSFPKHSFKKFVAVAMSLLIAIAPWLYYVQSLGSASNTRPMLPVPSSVDFFNVYSQFMFGFQTNAVNTIILSCWPIIMLISLLAIRRHLSLPKEVVYIATLAFVPIVIAFAVSLVVRPFFLSRYMIAGVASLIILTLWAISQYRGNIARVVASLVLIATSLSITQQTINSMTPVKENYRDAAEYINQKATPQDLVVLSSPFTVYPFEYYYDGVASIKTLPSWDRTSSGAIPAFDANTLSEQVDAYNQNHRYIYLLLSQDQGYQEDIENYYLTNFKQVSKKQYSDGVTLYVYQVGYYKVKPLSESPVRTYR
jgi:mannosyltransferase